MEIQIRGDFITLGQLLKVVGEVASGGEIKDYLSVESPLVNGEAENRRGRKLRPGDVVRLRDVGEVRCVAQST